MNQIINTKQQKELEALAGDVFNRLGSDTPAREIMIGLYLERYPERSRQQAEAVANAILKSVQRFEHDYETAQRDIDEYIANFQNAVEKDMSVAERCNYWKRFASVVSSAVISGNDGDTDAAPVPNDTDVPAYTDENATEELADSLKRNAADVILNSGFLFSAFLSQSNEIAAVQLADEAAGLLVDLGNREFSYAAVLSMVTYLQVRDGRVDHVPVDMGADQIATFVCAFLEQQRITEAVGDGRLAESIASVMLKALGVIVITALAAVLTVVVLPAAVAGFSVPLLGNLTVIPLAVYLCGVVYLWKKAFDKWSAVSEKVAGHAAVGMRALNRGLKKLAGRIKEGSAHAVEKLRRAKNTAADHTGKRAVLTELLQHGTN